MCVCTCSTRIYVHLCAQITYYIYIYVCMYLYMNTYVYVHTPTSHTHGVKSHAFLPLAGANYPERHSVMCFIAECITMRDPGAEETTKARGEGWTGVVSGSAERDITLKAFHYPTSTAVARQGQYERRRRVSASCVRVCVYNT